MRQPVRSMIPYLTILFKVLSLFCFTKERNHANDDISLQKEWSLLDTVVPL